jgi:spermidine synthase
LKVEARFALVLLCFLLSGFSALIYQTAWTRQFALIFGTSELAVATVLAAYMGGLAAGAAAAARWVERVTKPVALYGLLELGIALSALAVPTAMHGATWLYVRLFGGASALPESGGLTHATFYLACSFAILLVPTGFMGATLPILARHAVRRPDEIGSRIGLLYAANTAGAVAGTVAAGFILLPALGLTATIHVGVLFNALIFGVALLLGRSTPPIHHASGAATARNRSRPGRWMLPLIMMSGAASFSYEVLWTRLLGHLFGGSVFAFATMLASFLSGIAIGSAVASRFASSPERATRGFAVAQVGTAVLSIAAFSFSDELPALARSLTHALGDRTLADAAIAALTLLPAALCIGATVPFAIRVCARDAGDAGRASASVYSWNTIGAIFGAIGTGFFLLPALGYAAVVGAAATTNLSLALLAARSLLTRQRLLLYTSAAIVLCAVLLPPDPPWRLLRSSALDVKIPGGEIVYFGVGRSATVMLLEQRMTWRLRTNGLPEAQIHPTGMQAGSSPFNQWLGAGASLARPEARRMLVVGLGGGVVLESVPSLIESIDVVEIEPEVIEANRSIAPLRRRDPLSDPRVRLIQNDARAALLLANEGQYDIIVSQPSHPWTSGAAHLYTRQFFMLASERLSPGGVLAQWMSMRFIDEPLLRSLLATLTDVFPYVRVYRPGSSALLFLASDEPLDLEQGSVRAIEAAGDDYAELGIFRPEDVAVAQVFDNASSRIFSAGAELITDDRNLLQMRSLQAARDPRSKLRASALNAVADPLADPDIPWDRVELTRRLVSHRMIERAKRVASFEVEPAKRAAADGIIAAAAGRRSEGRRLLEAALELDPDSAPARAALLRLRRTAATRADPDLDALISTFPELERSVVDGWRAEAEDDWRALGGLESKLAKAAPTEPLYADAIRLRVTWRLADGDDVRVDEALALVDSLIPISRLANDWVLRAKVCVASGEERTALASLVEAASRLETSPHRRKVGWAALQVLESLDGSTLPPRAQQRLKARLRKLSTSPQRSARADGFDRRGGIRLSPSSQSG